MITFTSNRHEFLFSLHVAGFISSFSHLASELDRIWFTEYSRTKGIVGSSGFEHVFVGELADDKGEISGLHNWITVYKLEQAGKVNYKGYLKTQTVVCMSTEHVLLYLRALK